MPKISQFLGITIKMYFNDHNPPHFHALYGDDEAVFSIDPIEIINGKLPARVAWLVIEWAELRKKDLEKNWALLREKKFNKIDPLV